MIAAIEGDDHIEAKEFAGCADAAIRKKHDSHLGAASLRASASGSEGKPACCLGCNMHRNYHAGFARATDRRFAACTLLNTS